MLKANLATLALVALSLFGSSASAQGKKYALVVGVERYDPTQLSALDFAEDDALAIGKALEAIGFEVVVMTSQSTIPERQPVSANDILVQLERRIAKCTPDDVLLVSLSGHGVQLKNDPVDERGTKETYFCPQRAALGNKQSLLPMSEVAKQFTLCKAQKKLLLLDACRNEAEPKEAQNKAVEIELDPAGVTRRTPLQGSVALFSCSAKEFSFELKTLGHSAFSYFVIRYLSGHADANRYPRQEINLSELTTYVQVETRDFVDAKLNKIQTPELIVMDKGTLTNFSLGTRPRKTQTSSATGMQFVAIPDGEYPAGNGQSTTIPPGFYLGKHEVTQSEFSQVMVQNPSEFTSSDRLPVESVSWLDAIRFCNRLSLTDGKTPYYLISGTENEPVVKRDASSNGYRLPTSQEWLVAATAGLPARDAMKSWRTSLAEAAWFSNHTTKTNPVGGKQPNPFGCHDMLGNVAEWCDDSADGDPEFQLLCGGSWRDNSNDLELPSTIPFGRDNLDSSVGFRVCFTIRSSQDVP